MITPWAIYWITRLDSILNFFKSFTFVISFIFVIFFITGMVHWGMGISDDNKDDKKFGKKFLKLSIIISPFLLFCIFGIIFTPSTKEIIAIYAVPKMVNNEDVQQIPANFAKLINGKLQEWMKDVEIITKEKE